jgi:hypothetical protein
MASPPPEGLFYLAEEQILVCTTCQTGIRPGRMGARHLRDIHQWKGERLQTAVSYISTRQLRDPHTVDLPANGRAVIPALGRPWPGYRCRSCPYLSRSQKLVRVHIGQAGHRREDEREKGWERTRLQTFLRGRYARYWIVADEEEGEEEEEEEERDGPGHDGTSASAGTSPHTSPGTGAGTSPARHATEREDEAWTEMLTQYDAARAREQAERRRVAENPSEVENVSTWVREMGWAQHFAGKDLQEIHAAGLMPRAPAADAAQRQARRNEA